MKNKHLLVGRELGQKKWTLKIGAINVAIFGKYAADFGFLALVTLDMSLRNLLLHREYLNFRAKNYEIYGFSS